MDNDRFCRRCSVIRVNTLCNLYRKGYGENDKRALKDLQVLVKLAAEREYKKGKELLMPGLDPAVVRRLCWNVSSVLNDHDFKTRGIDLG
jgi:hypothetical protein